MSQSATLHPGSPLAEPPHEWRDAMRIIRDETVDLLDYRLVYRYMQSMIRRNPRLPSENLVYNWINASYAYATSMAVRRVVDPSKGTISLRRLLEQIVKHSTRITRTWFVNGLLEQDRSSADRDFDELAGVGNPHVFAAAVKADLDKLCQAADTVQQYTHEYLAHRSARPTTWLVTYADLNVAIEAIAQIANRYARLLKVGAVAETLVLEELKTAFQVPWDPEAISAKEEE